MQHLLIALILSSYLAGAEVAPKPAPSKAPPPAAAKAEPPKPAEPAKTPELERATKPQLWMEIPGKGEVSPNTGLVRCYWWQCKALALQLYGGVLDAEEIINRKDQQLRSLQAELKAAQEKLPKAKPAK